MNESIATVRKVMSRFSMSVTRFSYCDHGAFYNETVYGADDSNIDAPKKENTPLKDTRKYGGYKSLSTAYFAVVKSLDKKRNLIKTIERVPVLIDYKLKTDPDALIKYYKTYLTEPEIIIPKIGMKSLIEYNGMPVCLTGVTNDYIGVNNAIQWFTDNETDRYVKALTKLLDLDAKKQLDREKDFYEVHKNRKEEVLLRIDKESNKKFYDKIIKQLSRKNYQKLARSNEFCMIVIKKREKFNDISVFAQIKILYEIIKFLQCKALRADLKIIDIKHNGVLYFSKNITDADIVLINSSPCGLHVVKRKL